MQRNQIIIRSSPFLFLKRLVIIEFFFALLPFLVAWLIHFLLEDLTETYQILPFAGSISFTLFTALAATTAQVLIVAIAFLTWYLPVFVVDRHEVVQQRGSFLGDRKMANTPFIDQVSVKQGRLAKGLNYGTLIITASDSLDQPHLKDIPEPLRYAELIQEFAEPGAPPQMNLEPRTIAELVLGGERQNVEYKSSLVWDYHQ
jgi:membrane protein YdbS with pleckstrin-like domain